MKAEDNKNRTREIYRQSLASLKLEGLTLTLSQKKLVRAYQTGKLDKKTFIEQARLYAAG